MTNKQLPLIEKYRVKRLEDIKGQDLAIQDIKTFFKAFPRKKALILNGPAGTGKTSVTIALAKELNLELFELNASDLRNRAKLEEILKPATLQSSLFNKGKIILMDEADGITASDRGGLPELIAVIEKTHFPIIITANDIWQQKFSLLRQKCQLVNLKELKDSTILEILKSVLQKENKTIKLETIQTIAKKSRGDVRSALNDLEAALSVGEDEFISELYEREKEESIFNLLKVVFQAPTDKKIIDIYNSTEMQIDEIMLWVEENIPKEYSGKALYKAFESLSKADVFKGRIYRQQYWRFLVYQNFLLSAGISSATKLKSNKFTQYLRPSRILKIWMSNQKNAKKKSIIEKYSQQTHMSKKKAQKYNFFLPLILNNTNIQKQLDIDEKEQEYIQEKAGAIIVSAGLNRFREN
ncbi:replication factor C large subunit [Candidatus Pacearchaeota archaeon]|nr:replication factor C large subunit [Candidatus Pacearchaeota archaeon]